jgi:TonB family protein
VQGDGYVERRFVVTIPSAYLEYEVEKQVQTAMGSPQPRYPESLKARNVEGEVLMQFVVDTMGRADTSSFKVLRSTHEAFTRAVLTVLPTMRFYPAEIAGRKVKQMVQQPFTFAIAHSRMIKRDTGFIPTPEFTYPRGMVVPPPRPQDR